MNYHQNLKYDFLSKFKVWIIYQNLEYDFYPNLKYGYTSKSRV